MYGTQKQQLRKLSKQEFQALKTMSRLAKNMFNVGLYNVRQHYFETNKYLSYKQNNQLSKENENYKLLNTDAAQQLLMKVDESFSSFFSLLKDKSHKARIPNYLDKEGYFELTFPRIKLKKGNFFFLPMSHAFRREFGKVKIQLPSNLIGKKIAEIRIHPKYNASYFELEYVYKVDTPQLNLNEENALSIDLGVNNFATCVATTGASFIIDGKQLKSKNQWYNKRIARLQSIKDKQNIKELTKQQMKLLTHRNNFVRDFLNKSVRETINYCIQHDIGTIVVGHNVGWKNKVNIGKKNNQKFVQIPHSQFLKKLKSMCERYGMQFVSQEESYTSKASFLDGDFLPVYEKGKKVITKFSGRRKFRGLFRSLSGDEINADCNGAANILRKSNHRFDFERVARGLLANPERIRLV